MKQIVRLSFATEWCIEQQKAIFESKELKFPHKISGRGPLDFHVKWQPKNVAAACRRSFRSGRETLTHLKVVIIT